MMRTPAKKIVLIFAAATFAAGILALGATIWAGVVLGGAHIATPSLVATTFFFFCCAFVLYFMSVPGRSIPPDESKPGA